MQREMQYVLAVYRERGFSRAADKLYVSQPSLSAMIKRAEAHIGGEIFDRSTSPATLTQLGREYVRMALEIAKAEEEFEKYASDARNCLTGTLALGGTTLFTSFILPPLISEFSALHSKVEIQLHETHTAQLFKELQSGELELIVENSPLNPDVFAEKPLLSEHLILALPVNYARPELYNYVLRAGDVAAGAHLRDNQPALPLNLIAETPFLLLKEGNDTRTRADKLLMSADVRPNVRLLLDQQITAYNLACAGMGAAFISDTLVRHVPPVDSLRFCKLEPQFSARNVSFFYKKNRALTGAARAFIDIAPRD